MFISVVVLCYNQLQHVQRLTPLLLTQDYSIGEYEILVVDNGSSDGTAEWLRGQTDSILNSVILDVPLSRAAGRNRGIQNSRGDLIIMIDGDHTVASDFISSHARAHQQEVCVIVGKSDYARTEGYNALYTYLDGCGATKLSPGTKLPGRYFATGNCSIRKQTFEIVGLFDEAFLSWGGEDLDLGIRLERAGIPIYGNRDALAIHHHFRSFDKLLENKLQFGETSIPLLIKKHAQLFRELNLDRFYSNPFEENRFSAVNRVFYRLICTAPVFHLVRILVAASINYTVPRLFFDYLHLRQYATGFARSKSFIK